MTVQQALNVLPHDKGKDASLEKADEMVLYCQKQLDICNSDWAYWSILSDLEYWKAVRNILKAATIVGVDNLPDIPMPQMEGKVVMDSIYEVTKFGEAILLKSQTTPDHLTNKLKTNED